MKVAVRKLQAEDAAKLQMLVAENIDAIEPGLVVLDSRLLLGHATIDVVGLDASGALVLIATGITANEEMLLKAVEAYSWCREYPESLERLYPSCIISEERPPRLVFVVERMPDAFHRKIKQLGFPEVDCVEFRLLDVDGAPAVFFESILRLRRPPVAPAPAPREEMPADSPAAAENVIALNGPVAARATSLKLQKLLAQAASEASLGAPRANERPAPVREPASVVSMVSRQAAASVPRVERPRPEPVTLREPEPVVAPEPITVPVIAAAPVFAPQPEPLVVPAPVIVTPEPVIATPAPIVVVPTPVIVTPEPVVLPKAAEEPDADLVAQMERALAAIDKHEPAIAEPVMAEPTVAEPTLELVAAGEPTLELLTTPEPVAAAEPKLELLSASEPKLELAVEPAAAAPELAVPALAPSAPTIPALNGKSNGIPSLPSLNGSERVSLRDLPELSLRPSAPVAMPRPAPIPAAAPGATPAVGTETAAADAEPRVSFKDLAAALLGSTTAPVVAPVVAPAPEPAPPTLTLETASAVEDVIAQEVAAETAEPVIVQPVSPEMAQAVAELEPALTVEALINSTLTAEPVAPVAPEPAAVKPEALAAKKAAPEAEKPAALPLEFAGLQFPKDGVMTRQWMEFLSQMSNSK